MGKTLVQVGTVLVAPLLKREFEAQRINRNLSIVPVGIQEITNICVGMRFVEIFEGFKSKCK